MSVSKWPRCRWDVKHNQPTNIQSCSPDWRDLCRILFWILLHDPIGSMRDPVLESSPDCKRAASVNIDTNVTLYNRCLKPNGVAKYYQTVLYNELANSFIHIYSIHFIFWILLCVTLIFINNFLNIWLFYIIHFIEASYICIQDFIIRSITICRIIRIRRHLHVHTSHKDNPYTINHVHEFPGVWLSKLLPWHIKSHLCWTRERHTENTQMHRRTDEQ